MSALDEQGHGDCFRVAATIVTDGDPDMELCHGTPVGRGEANGGQRYHHAWVEQGDRVIDRSNGLNLNVSRGAYYSLGRIDEASVTRYTPAEARRLLLEHEHYGPWPK